jgi:hypothetical protein
LSFYWSALSPIQKAILLGFLGFVDGIVVFVDGNMVFVDGIMVLLVITSFLQMA